MLQNWMFLPEHFIVCWRHDDRQQAVCVRDNVLQHYTWIDIQLVGVQIKIYFQFIKLIFKSKKNSA